MNSLTLIGIAASVLTGISMVPQLVKTIREKKAEDISTAMLSVLCAGLLLWVWYGFRLGDWIIIISNSFSLLINLALIFFAVRFKK